MTLRWPPSDWEVVNGAQALHALSFLHGSSPAQTGAAHWPASGTCHMRLMNSGQQGWMVMAEVLSGGHAQLTGLGFRCLVLGNSLW